MAGAAVAEDEVEEEVFPEGATGSSGSFLSVRAVARVVTPVVPEVLEVDEVFVPEAERAAALLFLLSSSS